MNSYQALLEAMGGDTYENRRLVNDFAHHLARISRELNLLGSIPSMVAVTIDPYSPKQTSATWKTIVTLPEVSTDRERADRHAELEKTWNDPH